MRIELFASAAAFGAGSLYWLVAAQQMDASAYGTVMRAQAAILLCTGLLSCRTYDLVFFVQRRFGWDLRRGFVLALRAEVILAATAAPLAAATAFFDVGGASRTGVVCVAGLCTLGFFQGSTQALLRGTQKDRAVARADLVSSLAFVLAGAVFFATQAADPLLLWAMAFAVRPLVLLCGVRDALPSAHPPQGPILSPEQRSEVLRFLAAGQLTNLLKNNAIAIETLLLGRFSSNSSVALFRVSRALLNFSTVFLNIIYQKAFRELTHAVSPDDRRRTLAAVNLRSLGVWLLALPVVLVGAFAFGAISADPSYDRLLWVTVLLALAMTPAALQQGEFVVLSVSGRFSSVTASYAVSLAVLATGTFLLRERLSLEIFAGLLFAANLSRYGMLRRGSRQSRP